MKSGLGKPFSPVAWDPKNSSAEDEHHGPFLGPLYPTLCHVYCVFCSLS